MRLPSFAQLEPVGQCNLRCRMCPIQFRRDGPPWGPPALMRYELFTKIVDQFTGLRELHLQGLGEPTMHPRFAEMVRYAAARGITVSANSNCTLFNRERAEKLVEAGLDTLHVSIDGATRATYEHIRDGARFYRVLRGVKLVCEAKERLRSPSPKLRLVCVVMRRNIDELAELVRLAARLGIGSMFVQHLAHDFGEEALPAHYRPMRAYVDEQTLLGERPDRIRRAFSLARRAARESGVELRLPTIGEAGSTPRGYGRDRCDWPWRGAYISYQGLAMPCCMVATPDRAQLGDVSELDVESVWNGKAYRDFRRALDSDEPPAVCRSCSIYRGIF